MIYAFCVFIRSNNFSADSSVGSWGTSWPAKARAMTDNAQIIGLANSILSTANRALGKVTPADKSETEKQ